MSIKMMGEVWDSAPVDKGTLLVLLALADNAGDDHRQCWPGIPNLARRSRLSERQVKRCLRHLEDHCIISVQSHGSPLGTNLYTIATPSEWRSDILPKGEEVTFCPEEVTFCPSGSDMGVTQTVREPSVIKPSDSLGDFLSEGFVEGIDTMKGSKAAKTQEQFNEFWEAYPKRTGSNSKKKAKDKFIIALRKVSFDELMRAVTAYAAYRASENQPKYTAMATTWLNGEEWETWLAPEKRMDPNDPMKGIPEETAKVLRYDIDIDRRSRAAREWWATYAARGGRP